MLMEIVPVYVLVLKSILYNDLLCRIGIYTEKMVYKQNSLYAQNNGCNDNLWF